MSYRPGQPGSYPSGSAVHLFCFFFLPIYILNTFSGFLLPRISSMSDTRDASHDMHMLHQCTSFISLALGYQHGLLFSAVLHPPSDDDNVNGYVP